MPPNRPRTFDLAGLTDIPELLGIARQTPRQWRTCGALPEPQAVVSGSPVWERRTIIDWALGTRRIDRRRARDAGNQSCLTAAAAVPLRPGRNPNADPRDRRPHPRAEAREHLRRAALRPPRRRAVAMLSNRPEWNIVTGDLVWSKAYAYDDLFDDVDLHYRGHPDCQGDVEPVGMWVDYPEFGEMFCVQAWAWPVAPDCRAQVRVEGREVGSGDWHGPSQEQLGKG